MKAMVRAAGLGTRLRPLTNDRPKALVEVAGRTMLEITLARLRQFGIQDVIINIHHYADMVVETLKASGNFGMRIEFSREEILLDTTGGGLKQAAWFLQRRLRQRRRRALHSSQRGYHQRHRSSPHGASFTQRIKPWRIVGSPETRRPLALSAL